jgi:sterol desaturase/sphingolipid hydroxylase (fatty acid hydroxylase superfamily)
MAIADTIRLSAFVLVLAGMLVWEAVAARRALALPRRARWPANLALVLVGTLVVRLVVPLTLVEAATWAAGRGVGVFWQLGLPLRYAVPLALVALDLAVYAQHVAMHRVGAFWRVHRAHHADPGFDATTGVRFHPIELVISALFKAAVVVALGAPAVAVVLFEIWLNAGALFSHGNVSLPGPLDRMARRLFVTPDMHRVHHSVHRDEHDTNFGFGLSVWDRLFRTYRAQPRDGHDGMALGLGLPVADVAPLGAVLRLPFGRG